MKSIVDRARELADFPYEDEIAKALLDCVEALEFYSTVNHYDYLRVGEVNEDRGALARTTLRKVKGET